MINESEIEEKDFSIALPTIIEKLEIFSDLNCEEDKRHWGLSDILVGAIEDLKIINGVLHKRDPEKQKIINNIRLRCGKGD